MSQSVTVRLPNVLHERIDEIAVKAGITRSQQIIKTLEKAFLLPTERAVPATPLPRRPTPPPKPEPQPANPPASADECPHGLKTKRFCFIMNRGTKCQM